MGQNFAIFWVDENFSWTRHEDNCILFATYDKRKTDALGRSCLKTSVYIDIFFILIKDEE